MRLPRLTYHRALKMLLAMPRKERVEWLGMYGLLGSGLAAAALTPDDDQPEEPFVLEPLVEVVMRPAVDVDLLVPKPPSG